MEIGGHGIRCLRCGVTRENEQVPVVLASAPLTLFGEILSTARSALRGSELEYYGRLVHRRRQESFLVGRWVAKHVVSFWDGDGDVGSVEISRGVFDQPLVRGAHTEGCRISLSHDNLWAAALVFPEAHPMGLDVETVDPARVETIIGQLTGLERDWMGSAPDPAVCATALWTAREALSKVIGCGLTVPAAVLALKDFVAEGSGTWTGTFAQFSQYQARTVVAGRTLVSIVLPRRSDPGDSREWADLFSPPAPGPGSR